MNSLKGRVAVITGAAHGIGRALAFGLAAEGCRIVLADLPSEQLDSTCEEMRASGTQCLSVPTDVSSLEGVAALAEAAIAMFGAVHVLCNNAGVSLAGRLMSDLAVEDWRWLMGVNLWGPIHGIQIFLPILRAQEESHVLNTASIGAFRAGAFNGPYCASKAALLSVSETLYRECLAERWPVGVSVLCPGAVATTIGASDERRPSQFPGKAGPLDPRVAPGLEKTRAQGKSAEQCASAGIEAIKDNRFYVFNDREAFLAIADRDSRAMRGEQPSL